MKRFYCCCGQAVFFDNNRCLNCQRQLGFDPKSCDMVSLEMGAEGQLVSDKGEIFRYCRNHQDYGVCNWLLRAEQTGHYCESCRLNQVVPDLKKPGNVRAWGKLEAGKRHLLYTLLTLGLPIKGRREIGPKGLAFAFLEDRRFNAAVRENFIATGHANGLITLNLAEADDAYRERTRQQLGEGYRTVLGHFRHEIGHYYFDLLVRPRWLGEFISQFGDPDLDYKSALSRYYDKDKPQVLDQPQAFDGPEALKVVPSGFISTYAQAHPLEDWAETWSHYMHLWDSLETAHAYGLQSQSPVNQTFDELAAGWGELSVTLNALNRSMGLPDAYPFVLTSGVRAKLRLVHQVITAAN